MNLANEIKKLHKIIRKAKATPIVAPISSEAKDWLNEEGYQVGEAVTPCGGCIHNTIEHD